MWLINVSTLSLQAFHGGNIPPYAILSHTWEAEEVSFQEFARASESSDNVAIAKKAGYRKIIAFCELARTEGHSYVWVDTCCIDKTSSAELTEAINSMFGWYRNSQVCYAYLSDFEPDLVWGTQEPSEHTRSQFANFLGQCRWFTRGWCLQELLAPKNVCFMNQQWKEIGNRGLLSQLISNITGIPRTALTTPPRNTVSSFPIAVRISWISKRETTRVEDMSYSLLGILGVNMPTIYGEGHAAFTRLQSEIIRKDNDLSLFAFTGDQNTCGFESMLAKSPRAFNVSPSAGPYNKERYYLSGWLSAQYSLTNQGVFFPNAELRHQRVPAHGHQYLLDLHYLDKRSHHRYLLLQKIGPGLFLRIQSSEERRKIFSKAAVSSPFCEPVCVLHRVPICIVQAGGHAHWERHAVRLRWKPWTKPGRRFYHVRSAEPRANWDMAANQFLLQIGAPPEMHVHFAPGNHSTNAEMRFFVLVIGVHTTERRKSVRMVTARVVSAETWQRVNRTELGFRGNGLSEIPHTSDNTSSICIAGYDISMSVDLVKEPGCFDYYQVYLDWELAKERIKDVSTPSVVPDVVEVTEKSYPARVADADKSCK